ncbi:hypothetical protein ACWEQG_28960 [Microbispora sp. NPDC004025]
MSNIVVALVCAIGPVCVLNLVFTVGTARRLRASAFSVGCGACEERLPEFVRFAETFPGGRERVPALVVGTDGVAEKLARLSAGRPARCSPPRASRSRCRPRRRRW